MSVQYFQSMREKTESDMIQGTLIGFQVHGEFLIYSVGY